MSVQPCPQGNALIIKHAPFIHPVIAALDHPLFRKRERGVVGEVIPSFRQRRRGGGRAKQRRGESTVTYF